MQSGPLSFNELYARLSNDVKEKLEVKKLRSIANEMTVKTEGERKEANYRVTSCLLLILMGLNLGDKDKEALHGRGNDNNFISNETIEIKRGLRTILDEKLHHHPDINTLRKQLDNFDAISTASNEIILTINQLIASIENKNLVKENKDTGTILHLLKVYQLSLNEIIKRNKKNEWKIKKFRSEDPFFLIYDTLSSEAQSSPEITNILSGVKDYNANDNAESIQNKININSHLFVRLQLVFMNSLKTPQFKNDRDKMTRSLKAAELWDQDGSLNKVKYKEMAQKYPYDYHYQQLRYLLKDLKPQDEVNSILRDANKVLYPGDGQLKDEQRKLLEFYDLVLARYYHFRKSQKRLGSRSLANALEKFIKSPKYLDLMQSYTFEVPHVVGKFDNAPTVINSRTSKETTEKSPQRVAVVNPEVLFINGEPNKKLIEKLKAEYNEVVLCNKKQAQSQLAYENLVKELSVKTTENDPVSYLKTHPEAPHIKFSVFQNNDGTKSEVRNLLHDITFYTVSQEDKESKCWAHHATQDKPSKDDYQELEAALEIYVQTKLTEVRRSDSHHNSFFNKFFGMDAKLKTSAAEKMIRDILLEKAGKEPGHPGFSSNEIDALRSHRLGKLLAKYPDKLPVSFKIAETKRNDKRNWIVKTRG